MVGVASAAILHAVDEAEVVAHLMKERGAHVLDGSSQRASTDVDSSSMRDNSHRFASCSAIFLAFDGVVPSGGLQVVVFLICFPA